jgi:glutamate-1-semialdehyde 2,1-aminomutase
MGSSNRGATAMISEETSRSSAALLAAAESVFPGGVLGTFSLGEQELVVSSGKGALVTTVDGRELIDYILGSGPMLVGHAHPQVTEAIAEQAERGTSYYALNEPAVRLAQKILEVFPANSRLLFTSSGSEATFYALRLARAFTGREKVLKFAGAYHGHHDYVMVEPWARATQPDGGIALGSAGIPEGVTESVLVAPFNDERALESLFARSGDSIAAVIVEPHHRVIEPDPGYLAMLTDIAHAHGALVVADEVVTGYRIKYGLAQAVYGFQADLTALGKVIGGGLPMAAVAGRSDVMSHADVRRKGSADYVYVSGTLSGNALAAAAGLATLAILEAPGTYEQLSETTTALREGLEVALKGAGLNAVVAGVGAMFHPIFANALPRSSAELAASDLALGRRFGEALINHGILVNPVQRSYVSLAHDRELVVRTNEAFRLAAQSVAPARVIATA